MSLWGELGEALDGSAGKPGQDIGEIFADGQAESAAAFDDGEDCGHLRSGLLTAEVDPVAAADGDGAHGVLGEVVG